MPANILAIFTGSNQDYTLSQPTTVHITLSDFGIIDTSFAQLQVQNECCFLCEILCIVLSMFSTV